MWEATFQRGQHIGRLRKLWSSEAPSANWGKPLLLSCMRRITCFYVWYKFWKILCVVSPVKFYNNLILTNTGNILYDIYHSLPTGANPFYWAVWGASIHSEHLFPISIGNYWQLSEPLQLYDIYDPTGVTPHTELYEAHNSCVYGPWVKWMKMHGSGWNGRKWTRIITFF